jgi:hypothetical protein
MKILIISVSVLIAFSCNFNNHIMEENQNDTTGITVLFKDDVTVEIKNMKRVLINGVNELDELFIAHDASIEKLLHGVDEGSSEYKTLERYYVVYTRVHPEKLRDELLKFNFIEAAYIKSKDEDPDPGI